MNNSTPTATTTMTSREFNQDTARAKRAARSGPVFITDRGKPSHVLMSMTDYERLKDKPMTLREALVDPNGDDFHYEFPHFKGIFKGFEFD